VTEVQRGVERARALLGEASHVLVLTGAGISAESGVPTFRGPQGLWREFRPEDLATPDAFAGNPRLVWEWYGWRRDLIARCRPNAAHVALARWQARAGGVRIATQNVDGLHARARESVDERGADVRPAGDPDLLELHGSIFRVRCTACGDRRDSREPIDATDLATLPRCAACRGLLRPDVVWFGESLDRDAIGRAFTWAERADVCLVIGTSAIVQPAASLATVTLECGGAIVEVNPEETPLTPVATSLIRGGAAEIVPRIIPGIPG